MACWAVPCSSHVPVCNLLLGGRWWTLEVNLASSDHKELMKLALVHQLQHQGVQCWSLGKHNAAHQHSLCLSQWKTQQCQSSQHAHSGVVAVVCSCCCITRSQRQGKKANTSTLCAMQEVQKQRSTLLVQLDSGLGHTAAQTFKVLWVVPMKQNFTCCCLAILSAKC